MTTLSPSVGPREWKILFAAQLGWMLDGMDVMLYAFALTSIQREFGLTSAWAGGLASATLITSALGGTAAGYLADRFGRARVLVWSILVYSIFTGMTATSHSYWELAVWRGLVGIGLGAEWAAGSVLVAETWPARHRGKAIGFVQSGWAIGYILAAALAALVMPRFGWRPLFIAGTLPALLAFWVRRDIPEPEVWKQVHQINPLRSIGSAAKELWRPPLRGRMLAATLVASLVMFAYWGLFTWIPAYLASPVERGGAGFSTLKTSGWVVAVQVGAFLGYNLFGLVSDRLGRRPAFMAFTLCAAGLVPLYAQPHRSAAALLALGPLIGFFGHGYFSVFGAYLAELFPSGVRATALGVCYNVGRAAAAAAPVAIGAIADAHGIAVGLGATSAFFAASAFLVLLLPETRGKQLA